MRTEPPTALMRESQNALPGCREAGQKQSARRLRVLHVINSFEHGGAEAMLCNLLLRVDRDRFDVSVVALIDDLTTAGPLLRAGVPVTTMGMRPGVPNPAGVLRLARHLRQMKPDVVQSWMDHSNLITGLAARLAGRRNVVWGIHHSHHVPGVAKRSTLLTVAACAKLSRLLPARIVYCSEHSRRMYEERGFAAERGAVIPNGFDVKRFQPDAAARADVRREIGVGDDAPLVGLVARYDPFKDHSTFLKAAALLATRRPGVRFVLCGHKVDADNVALAAEVAALGLDARCHLLGARRDVPRVYAALDVLASSSISEAFPLVVGEAMACGVPCVVTDVGDSALLVGPTGKVVPPSDPAALAAAWEAMLALPAAERVALGAAARRRVRERFELEAVGRRYEAVYEALAEAGGGARERKSTRRGDGDAGGDLFDEVGPGRAACGSGRLATPTVPREASSRRSLGNQGISGADDRLLQLETPRSARLPGAGAGAGREFEDLRFPI